MNIEEDHIWSTSSSRVLKIQGLTILSLLLLNTWAQIYLSRHPVTITRALVTMKWRLLLSGPEPADVVIVGDSTAAFSLNPDKLAKKSGLKVQNFATVGDLLALDDAWAFNHYVKNVGSPKVLIVMRYFPFWELDNQSALLQAAIPLPWKYWERLEPGVRTSWPHNINYLLARYLPIYRRSYSIKSLLRFWRRGLQVESVNPTGSLNLSVGPDWKFGPYTALPERLKISHPFVLSELNLFALNSMQQTCQRTGTTMIIVNAPIFREDADLDHYQTYISEERAALSQYADSHSNVVFMMQEPMILDESELFDTIHPNDRGSELVTERLHQELKRASEQR